MNEADWYVLEVGAKTELEFLAGDDGRVERRAQFALRSLGLMAQVPIEMRTRRAKGRNNQPVVSSYPAALLPGYVFVGTRGEINWPFVRAIKEVRGVLRSDGRPARLSLADVVTINRLCKETHVGGTLQVGAEGRILRGPFRDLEAVIRAIRPDLVRVSVHVFGAEREISVTADNIESV